MAPNFISYNFKYSNCFLLLLTAKSLFYVTVFLCPIKHTLFIVTLEIGEYRTM